MAEYGCGGCHQWGCNPRIEKGKCTACERTPEEIEEMHGFVMMTEAQLDENGIYFFGDSWEYVKMERKRRGPDNGST